MEVEGLEPSCRTDCCPERQWEQMDLNHRPTGYQPIALTAELRSQTGRECLPTMSD